MENHVGFTGSRAGLSAEQHLWLYARLAELSILGFNVLHHGDCVGADAAAHKIAKELGYRTIAHPPVNPKLRAFCDADEIRELKPYIERDHDIVREVEYLLAAPAGPEQELVRSGTWTTVRFAKARQVRQEVCLP